MMMYTNKDHGSNFRYLAPRGVRFMKWCCLQGLILERYSCRRSCLVLGKSCADISQLGIITAQGTLTQCFSFNLNFTMSASKIIFCLLNRSLLGPLSFFFFGRRAVASD